MTKKKRKIAQEQLTTAINICKEEGLTLDDVDTVYTIYKAMSAAIGRVKHNPSYRDRGILFTIGDKAKSATVNVIHSHHFENVKRLNKDFEASGFDINYRIELDRIDNEGNYSLDNINFTTRKEHVQKSKDEKCIPVHLLAFDEDGGLRLGNFNSKDDAKKSLHVNYNTLNKLIDGNCEYTNTAGDKMTFLQLELITEPLPEDFKIRTSRNMKEFLGGMSTYIQKLKNFQQFDYCEKREKAITDLSKRLDYYTQRENKKSSIQ